MPLVQRSTRRAIAILCGGALALGACSSNTAAPPTVGTSAPTTTTTIAVAPGLKLVDTPYGKAVGRSDGHVLYAWDKESEAGDLKALCVEAACLEKWPPLLAETVGLDDSIDPHLVALLERPDGKKQVSYNGHRLYAMSADEVGDANCQGVEGWWIMNANGTKNTNRTAGSTGTTIGTIKP